MRLQFPNGDHGEVAIERGTLSLGSAAGNDVVLEAEGIEDSHARLAMEADGLFLRPVGEADVYVNGRRIRDRTHVEAGDVLGLHKVQVRLARAEGGQPGAPGGGGEAPAPDPTRIRPAITDWQLRGVSGESFGRVVPLQGRVIAGRGEGCDIVLEATEVSRQHAALEVQPDGVLVEDLDSSNGTFINGERVRKKQAGRGDEIAFDKLRFRLEMATRPETVRRPSPSPSPSSSPRPAPKPPKRRGSGMGIWLVVVGIVVIAAAAGAWYLGYV